MVHPLSIYLAQTHPMDPMDPRFAKSSALLFPSVSYNLDRAVEHIRRASVEKADIIVLPEFGFQGGMDQNPELALTSVFLFDTLKSLSSELNIAIVGTIIEPHSFTPTASSFLSAISAFSNPFLTSTSPEQKMEWDSAVAEIRKDWSGAKDVGGRDIKYSNTAFYISGGELVGRYEKKNLWHPEREFYSAGNEYSQAFLTPWGKVGLLVCWDLSHPAATQHLTNQEVSLIIAPTYWRSNDSDPEQPKWCSHSTENEVLQALSLVRAFESETVLVLVNPGNEEGYEEKATGLMGGSAVFAPFLGRVAGVDGGNREGWKVVKVDMDMLKAARNTFKIRDDFERVRKE